MQNLNKIDLSFPNFHWLKYSDFILESKMAELNQNKNLNQLDRRDAVRELYFYLRNKQIAQLTELLTHDLQNLCS